jgi:hypothetical protein
MASEAQVAIDARPQRVICVLGMHRSGTSCLAGSLEQQGLFLGEVNTSAPFNRRGNRERFDVMNLQEDILVASGGSWLNPPAVVLWQPEQVRQAQAILAGHAGVPVWGFKDPRTLLTFDGWQQLVPGVEAVGIFRHPLRVAQSLQSRNDLALDAGLELWSAYNERLVEIHRRRPFPIVCFDDEPATLEVKLREAGEAVGLGPAPDGEPFFADDLRNAPAEGGSVPSGIQALYDHLRRLSL